MEVEPRVAAASKEHDGTMRYFCSDGCLRQFEENPSRYTAT
jgi:YHS domain-containing protein